MGLLKFFEVKCLHTHPTLLSQLVALWRVEGECGYFYLQGTRLSVTLEDGYFLTGLPTMGLIETSYRILSRGWSMEDLIM